MRCKCLRAVLSIVVAAGFVACRPQALGEVEHAPTSIPGSAAALEPAATSASPLPTQVEARSRSPRELTLVPQPAAQRTAAPTREATGAPGASPRIPQRERTADAAQPARPVQALLHSLEPPPPNECTSQDSQRTLFGRWLWEDYIGRRLWEDYIQWSPDGSTIVFARGPVLAAVTADGTRIWPIADAGVHVTNAPAGATRRLTGTTIPFDGSPDGTRVVYATCRYGSRAPGSRVAQNGFDLAVVGLDGAGRQRLTSSDEFESHPAWSPDGRRIAHLYGRSSLRVTPINGDSPLDVVLPSGTGVKPISEEPNQLPAVITQAPAWSPDGRLIAVAAEGGMFLVGTDDGTVRQVAATVVGGPSWSPDGTRMALVRPAGHEVALVTIAVDGTDEERLANFVGWPDGNASEARIPTVAWSPDGSKILVVLQPGPTRPGTSFLDHETRRRVYVVTVTGQGRGQVRRIGSSWLRAATATWSPDGARLAVGGWPNIDLLGAPWAEIPAFVFTVAAAGHDRQFVAARRWDGQLEPWQAPRPYDPDQLAACRTGGAVADAAGNRGLVDDCAALLELSARAGGSWYVNWSADLPLDDWYGVGLGGTPPRVRVLRLADGWLRDRDPRALRWLTELWLLELSEFGLSYFPRELGQLRNLEELRLAGSHVGGRIPAELGQLSNLRFLDLSKNRLTEAIPRALGQLAALTYLDLSGNQLTGLIPPTLGQLSDLTYLDLSHNQLTGPIPAELSQLARLREVRLAGNQLTGCVPAGLPVVDREELELPDCEAGV